jgi:hypothetical protein
MKKRMFGSSLILSAAYAEVEPITGVELFDLTLTAAAEYMDASGNVVCPQDKVLVLGTLTILPLSA